jgi:hypothetical protein
MRILYYWVSKWYVALYLLTNPFKNVGSLVSKLETRSLLITCFRRGLRSLRECLLTRFRPCLIADNTEGLVALTFALFLNSCLSAGPSSGKSSSCLKTRKQLPCLRNLITFVTGVGCEKTQILQILGAQDSGRRLCATNGDIAVFVFDYGIAILAQFTIFIE